MNIKIWVIVLLILLSGINSFAADEEKLWSFEFNGLTISDILNKLSEASGVRITLNGKIDDRHFTKSYKDYSLESILTDIFRGSNMAVLFNYTGRKLDSVSVWMLPENSGKLAGNNNLPVNQNRGNGAGLPQGRAGKTTESSGDLFNPFEDALSAGTVQGDNASNIFSPDPFMGKTNIDSESQKTDLFQK